MAGQPDCRKNLGEIPHEVKVANAMGVATVSLAFPLWSAFSLYLQYGVAASQPRSFVP